jgi:hypothetical protein
VNAVLSARFSRRSRSSAAPSRPDYAGGRITLLPAFFAEVRDGATVNLRFHFWSGSIVDYPLTRSGSQVTGTASVG